MAELIYILEPAELGVPARITACGWACDDEEAKEFEASFGARKGREEATCRWSNPIRSADLLTREELEATAEGRQALVVFESRSSTDVDEHHRRQVDGNDREEIKELAVKGDDNAMRLVLDGFPEAKTRAYAREHV
jgi:hypothetical protein